VAQPKLRWAVGLVIVAFLVGCGGYVVPANLSLHNHHWGAHIATVVPTAPATRSVAVDSLPLANPPEFVFPRPVQRQVMPLPRQPQLQVLTNALTAPVFVTHAPGDLLARLFVLEQAGPIRVWQNGQLLPTPFLDLTALVESAANEQGLLGLAFAPNFAESRWFWVYYTTKDQSAVLVRYRAEPGLQTADPASAALVLRISDRVHTNHNGGMLAFGSDGYLYLALGDGGGGWRPRTERPKSKTMAGKVAAFGGQYSHRRAGRLSNSTHQPFRRWSAGRAGSLDARFAQPLAF
jgi:glucose/arabinose dehydrogenase